MSVSLTRSSSTGSASRNVGASRHWSIAPTVRRTFSDEQIWKRDPTENLPGNLVCSNFLEPKLQGLVRAQPRVDPELGISWAQLPGITQTGTLRHPIHSARHMIRLPPPGAKALDARETRAMQRPIMPC